MDLVIDIGNSASKLAAFNNDKLLWVWNAGDIAGLKKLRHKIRWENVTLDNSIVSSVVGSDKRLVQLLTAKTKMITFSHKTPLPFKNRYKTPGTLGHDRIASVAGAQKAFPQKNVLVIDAGTCIKYDFINSKGEYPGGSISPGLQMRFKALHNFTSQLPLIKPGAVSNINGNSTETSILTGVVAGMVNEINGFINLYTSKYKQVKIILTGGDSKFLGRQLKSSIFAGRSAREVILKPHLTLEGLHAILKYNVDKN